MALTTSVAGLLQASNAVRFAAWPAETAVSTASTTDVARFGDNYLYVFKAAPRGCATRRSEALLFEWG